jgi:ABC-type dipeptide/oligopeptide/nickel transport system permease subunit
MLEGVSEEHLEAFARVRRRGYWSRSWRRFFRERVALFAALAIAVVVGAGLLARWLAPYDYQHFDIRAVNLLPTLRAHHFFGTDGVGHDVFSRTLYSIQTSILVGVVVAVAAGALGLLVGALAGYYRGWLDAVVMWLVQFLTAIPALGLLFAGIVLVGRAPRPRWVAEALILYLWTGMARVVRASLIALRETEYVEAARAAGASDFRIIVRHLIPNAAPAVLVTATALVGQTILL